MRSHILQPRRVLAVAGSCTFSCLWVRCCWFGRRHWTDELILRAAVAFELGSGIPTLLFVGLHTHCCLAPYTKSLQRWEWTLHGLWYDRMSQLVCPLNTFWGSVGICPARATGSSCLSHRHGGVQTHQNVVRWARGLVGGTSSRRHVAWTSC